MRRSKIFLIVFFIFNITNFCVLAQEEGTPIVIEDSLQQVGTLSENAQEIETDSLNRNRPLKAALYAAVLPGLGQVYNKSYWKLPIVYGLATFTGFLLHRNHQLYKESLNSFNAQIDGDPRTQVTGPLARYDQEIMERVVQGYERNRDLTILWSVALYFIQIIDAHVDAHLNEFEISDDISMNLVPAKEHFLPGTTNYGLTMKITF